MRHKRKVGFLLLLLLLTLSGCWNKIEIEENAFVLAIGVDKGEQDLYRITMAMARPEKLAGKEGGGGGGGEEKPLVLSTIEAPSLTGALSMLNGYIGRNVTLQHAKALFVSEELARDGNLQFLDEVIRYRETRQTIFLVVTKQDASQFLEGMKPELGKNPMRYIEQLTYNYRRTAMLPAASQISDFVSQVNVNYSQPLSYYAALVEEEESESGGGKAADQSEASHTAGELPRQGGSNVEMIGGAAFKQQKMVGTLSGEEIRHYLLLHDAFHQAVATFKDPKEPESSVSVRLSRKRPSDLWVDVSGSRPRLSAAISLEGEILGVQSGVDYSEPEQQAALEASIEQQIEDSIRTLIKRTQEWESDIVGFGRHAVPQFPTVEAWETYDWPSKYPKAEVQVDVRFTLRRFGLTLSPLQLRQ